MTDEQWYDHGQAHCGIGVGDKVKVLREAGNQERGWSQAWDPEMDRFVGQTLTVSQAGKAFCCIPGYWWFPFFVLELIEKAKPEPELPQSILDIINEKDFCSWTRENVKRLVTEILKQVKLEK